MYSKKKITFNCSIYFLFRLSSYISKILYPICDQVGSYAMFILRHRNLTNDDGMGDLQHIANVIVLNMVRPPLPSTTCQEIGFLIKLHLFIESLISPIFLFPFNILQHLRIMIDLMAMSIHLAGYRTYVKGN